MRNLTFYFNFVINTNMNSVLEDIEKNINELIRKYNKLKEDNSNLHKKLALFKSKIEENDSKKIKAVNKLTKIINEIEQYISGEDNMGVTSGKGNE